MYQGNRPNLLAASNMQGSTNSANATNFNLGNTTSHGSSRFYMHGRMAAGEFSSADHIYAQAAIGNFFPRSALHVKSEAEHIPHCGNGDGGLVENTNGRANQFPDGGRSCKRKILGGVSDYSYYDGPSHSFSWQRGSLSRFTVPARHDTGTVSSFATPALTPASARYWEEPLMPRLGLMGGPSMAPDYSSRALFVTGEIEGPQRSVQRRSNPTYHEEQNLLRSRPSRNYDWHVQPRNAPAEQPNIHRAATNASAILCDQCQFPSSSVFQRRNLVTDKRSENMLTGGSRFSFNAIGRERPSSLHAETSSSSMIPGVPSQGWPMSGADSRISDNYLSSRVPITRNLSEIPYTDLTCANPILSSRATEPWYRTQNPLMQIPRANSDVAQGSMCSSMSGQGNHLTHPSGAISSTPVDMVINPVIGLQGPCHLRSSWMEHCSDQNLRPLTRSILDISFERLQTLQNEGDRDNGVMSEVQLVFNTAMLALQGLNYHLSLTVHNVFHAPCLKKKLGTHVPVQAEISVLDEVGKFVLELEAVLEQEDVWWLGPYDIMISYMKVLWMPFMLWVYSNSMVSLLEPTLSEIEPRRKIAMGYIKKAVEHLGLQSHGVALRTMEEDFLLFDPLEFYGVVDLHDQHRDMRLDVDNMTYEELLALGERIGNVSTGLTEKSISKCLKMRMYSSSTKSSAADEASQKCNICQEAYEDDEELGTLECGHDHHTECIKKWLMQKNECPVCKASAKIHN